MPTRQTETIALLCVSALFLITPAVGMADETPLVLTRYTQLDSKLGVNAQPNGQPLQVADKTYQKGFDTSTVVMEFELKQEFASFSADIGMAKGATIAGEFTVLLDEAIFFSGSQNPKQPATSISVLCPTVSKITLVSKIFSNRGYNSRAVWGDARVETAAGETVYLSDVLKWQDKLPWNKLGLGYMSAAGVSGKQLEYYKKVHAVRRSMTGRKLG